MDFIKYYVEIVARIWDDSPKSVKTDINSKIITKVMTRNFMMIKGTLHQENIITVDTQSI